MRYLTKIIIFTASLFVFLQAIAATASTNNTYTEDKPGIGVTADHPQFTIKLQSNPSTGYSWFLRSYDASLVQSVSHQFKAPAQKKLIGAPGYEYWTFHLKPSAFQVPQQTVIRFVYARPWEGSGQSKQVSFTISTEEHTAK